MKRYPLSLRIFLIHTGLVTLAILLITSPLSDKPGAIHPVLILPFFYIVFSAVLYFVSLVCGILEFSKDGMRAASGIAIASSLLMLSVMTYGIYTMWPAWMGI
ncbi:MAG: hypothetical protein ACSHX7_09480 [Luteolibacter sp.]